MTIEIVLILTFGTLFGGFMVAGLLSLREFDNEAIEEAQQKVAVPVRHARIRERAGAAVRRVATIDPFLDRLERHLRHELALARAFAENPSIETLWA